MLIRTTTHQPGASLSKSYFVLAILGIFAVFAFTIPAVSALDSELSDDAYATASQSENYADQSENYLNQSEDPASQPAEPPILDQTNNEMEEDPGVLGVSKTKGNNAALVVICFAVVSASMISSMIIKNRIEHRNIRRLK